jgi:energy-coupling factor transporter ATP-binding protein EcfA2
MAPRQAVLGMEQASFFYGSSRVFENVSFLLDDARTALVGENGAGKSTLLKCLTGGLLELNEGQVIRSRSACGSATVPQDVPEGLCAKDPCATCWASAWPRPGRGRGLAHRRAGRRDRRRPGDPRQTVRRFRAAGSG